MSWDDDDDAFYAGIDWEAHIQQARARPPARPPQQPTWQQHGPPGQQPLARQQQLQQQQRPQQQQPLPPPQQQQAWQQQPQQQQRTAPGPGDPGQGAGQPVASNGLRSLFTAGSVPTGAPEQRPGQPAAPAQQPVRQQSAAQPYQQQQQRPAAPYPQQQCHGQAPPYPQPQLQRQGQAPPHHQPQQPRGPAPPYQQQQGPAAPHPQHQQRQGHAPPYPPQPLQQQGRAPSYPQAQQQWQQQLPAPQQPHRSMPGQAPWQAAQQQACGPAPPQQQQPQQRPQNHTSKLGPPAPLQPYGAPQGLQQQPYGQHPPPQQPGGPWPPGPAAAGGMVAQQRPSGGGVHSGAANGHLGAGSGHMGAGSGHAAAGLGHGSGMASGGSNPLLYINLELGKDQLIEVKCGHHEAVSAALKRLPGGQWDPKARHWRFPLNQHDRLVQALQALTGVRVRLEPLHPLVTAVLRAASSNPDDSDRYCTLPKDLEQQLMPFQREGVKFALRRGGRVLIGDEMGLGKTVQAIAVAAAYRDEWPLLVIAPSSLREAWADALHRWLNLTEDKMHVVHSGKDAAKVPSDVQCLIISYNFVQKMDLSKKFRVVVADECHALKESSAQRTKATIPLIKEARRAILLSGTPALNKPKEIFQQLSALVPSAKLKMSAFGERYCQGNHFDKYGGASNLGELNAMLKSSVLVRRLKRDVLTQLPSKRRQQVILCLDSEAKKMLAGLQKQLDTVRQLMGEEARKSAASGGAISGSMAQNTVITELYKKTAEVKAKAVQEYVQLLLDNGQKFLIFAHHTSLLDAIEHTCNRHKGCQHIRIDGSTPPAQRQSLVNKFQENADVRVAILSIKAAGTGLTLTAASTVVFAEMTWTPGEIIQAEDRAHRIGQASSVNVIFLHAKLSSDDLIWASLEKKLDTVGEAIDGEGQALHARRTEASERGQMGLQQFMTQSRPGEAAPRQHWHPGGGKAGGAAAAAAAGAGGNVGGGKSPGKTTQATLLNFFGGSRQSAAQQQQQQQQGPSGGGQQQQQQQQQQQAMPPGGEQQQLYGMQQQAQQTGPLPQNASRLPAAYPKAGQGPPPMLRQPLHGANLQQPSNARGKPAGGPPGGQQAQQQAQQQALAGTKRPFGA